MINLGNKVRNTINGFSGMAIARTEFLHGCAQIMVESSELKDGKPVESQVFDEQNLETTEEAKPFKTPDVRIPMGSRVRDTWTGFEGILSGRTVSLYRGVRLIIAPTALHEGKPIDSFYFEDERVDLVKKDKPKVSKESSASAGGPQRYPANR